MHPDIALQLANERQANIRAEAARQRMTKTWTTAPERGHQTPHWIAILHRFGRPWTATT